LYETNDGYLPPPDDKIRVNYFSDLVVVQESKQSDVTTQVQEQKPGNKTQTTPSPASAAPKRDAAFVAPPMQYPYVISGNIVVEGVWSVSNYPKQPLPSGYILTKKSDLALRFVTPSLLEAYPDQYNVVENPDVVISNAPPSAQIQLLSIAQ